MSDNLNQGDQLVKEKNEAPEKVSDNVASQVIDGKEDLSKSTVDYYESRKAGMRDVHTAEHLGAQPEFYDSAADKAIASHDAADYFGTKPKDAEIERNKDGYVTKVTDKQGFSREYSYDEHGEVSEVKYSSGTKLTRVDTADGAEWEVTDRFGNKSQRKGEIHVTPNGDDVLKERDGTTTVTHPDGSKDRTSDGGTIHKDPQGHITEITDPSGKTKKVDYDADGNPSKVKGENSEWRKEKDGWNEYGADGKKTGGHAKELDVNSDGAVVRRTQDGHVVREQANGVKTEGTVGTTRDDNGRVTDITYPDGTQKVIQYDKDGKVTGVIGGDTDLVKDSKDGKWKQIDKDGNKTDALPEDITVTPEGDIVYKNGDMSSDEQNADGTGFHTNHDKSEFKTDKDGRITDIKYPDGDKVQIEYDKSGSVTKVHNADNTEWRREKDGTYSKYDGDKKIDHIDGQILVHPSGTVETRQKDGAAYRQGIDGSYGERNKDGSVVNYDADKKVSNVVYPDGEKREMLYDNDGKLKAIEQDNGKKFVRESDGTWGIYDGKNKVKEFKGDVTVDDEGAIVATGADGSVTRQTRDGKKVVVKEATAAK
jgi:YD repeat-containing protein